VKRGWVVLSLAAAGAGAAGILVAVASRAKRPVSPAAPSSGVAMTEPEVRAKVTEWLGRLGVTGERPPGSKPAPTELVTQASVFASQLDQMGYSSEAERLRAGVQAAVTFVPDPAPEAPEVEAEPEEPVPEPAVPAEPEPSTEPREGLDADDYLIGWRQTSSSVQLVVRDALLNLGTGDSTVVTQKPNTAVDFLVRQNAAELERVGQLALANNLLRLLEDAASLEEAA
jgi:hypothetical protein